MHIITEPAFELTHHPVHLFSPLSAQGKHLWHGVLLLHVAWFSLILLSLALPCARRADAHNPLLLGPVYVTLCASTFILFATTVTIPFAGHIPIHREIVSALQFRWGLLILLAVLALQWMAWWPWMVCTWRRAWKWERHSHPIDFWCFRNQLWLLPTLSTLAVAGLITVDQLFYDAIHGYPETTLGIPTTSTGLNIFFFIVFTALTSMILTRLGLWIMERRLKPVVTYNILLIIIGLWTLYLMLAVHAAWITV
jgi:hypothetical protein